MSISEFKWWRVVIVAAIAAGGYVVVLRGLIEFLHPKFGWLVAAVYAIGGSRVGDWTYLNICIPVYDFLTGVVWGLLWPDLVTAVLVAVWVEYWLVRRRARISVRDSANPA